MKQILKGFSFTVIVLTIALSLLSFLLSSCGNSSTDGKFKLIPVRQKEKGRVSLMDVDGKIVLEDEFSAESQVYYSEGIVFEMTKDNKVKYYKIEGNKSKSIGDKEYTDGTLFYNGYAVVKKENGMLSLIDNEGKEKIPNLSKIGNVNIVRVGSVSEDMIRFKNDEGMWGYLNLKGEILIKPEYSSCENFNNGMARVVKSNGLFAVINSKGEEIFKGKDKYYYGRISEGLIPFKENTGEKDYFGYMDMKGEKVIKDNKYASCSVFKNGMATVREDEEDSWGVINKKGEAVGSLKTKFENEPIISNDGKVFIYDKDNKKIKVFNDKGEDLKKDIEDYKSIIPLSAKRFLAQTKSDKWIIIDENAKEKAKDQFYISRNVQRIIEIGINDYAALGNLMTMESSYYDFDVIYKDVFKNISVNGAFDLNANSTFGQILNQYKYESSSSNVSTIKSIDKSDDYREFMYSKENDSKSSSETNALDPTMDEIKRDELNSPSSNGSDGINYYSYSPLKRISNGISYELTFNFDTYLKTYDPYNYSIQILNKEAKVTSVSCRFDLYDVTAQKVFLKSMESKLTSAGWKKINDYSYNNSNNSNIINLSGSTITFSFRADAAMALPYGEVAPAADSSKKVDVPVPSY